VGVKASKLSLSIFISMIQLTNILKEILYKNQMIIEFEDGGPEERAFDVEFENIAKELAAIIDKELKAKQAESPEPLSEAIVAMTIGAVLASPLIVSSVSSLAKKLAKRFNWQSGENFADKALQWSHDSLETFQKPLKFVLRFFIKDSKKLDEVTTLAYGIIIGMMANGYGPEALNQLEKAEWFKNTIKAVRLSLPADLNSKLTLMYPKINFLFK
jgi:hypothetical protein